MVLPDPDGPEIVNIVTSSTVSYLNVDGALYI